MIRHILFDMGNVLIRFEPALFIARAGASDEDASMLLRVVYHSLEWVALDRGELTDGEALARMRRQLPPRLHNVAEELVSRWDNPYLPVPGMPELVRELAGRGYDLYLLTNAALRHREYWPRFPVARYFGDRIMRSADDRLLKPEPAFYETALARFGLDARACVFIDDAPLNVEGAARCGIGGIVFHGDAELLRRALRERDIL